MRVLCNCHFLLKMGMASLAQEKHAGAINCEAITTMQLLPKPPKGSQLACRFSIECKASTQPPLILWAKNSATMIGWINLLVDFSRTLRSPIAVVDNSKLPSTVVHQVWTDGVL